MCKFSHVPAKSAGKIGFILDNSSGKRYPDSTYSVIHKPGHVKCHLQRLPRGWDDGTRLMQVTNNSDVDHESLLLKGDMEIIHCPVNILFCLSARAHKLPWCEKQDYGFWISHSVDQTGELFRFVHRLWKTPRSLFQVNLSSERRWCYDILDNNRWFVSDIDATFSKLLDYRIHCGDCLFGGFRSRAYHFARTKNQRGGLGKL